MAKKDANPKKTKDKSFELMRYQYFLTKTIEDLPNNKVKSLNLLLSGP